MHSLALRSNGTIVGWGNYWHGVTRPPSGHNYIAIAAGGFHGLALRSNGTIVGWGNNWYGQANSPSGANFIAIAGGYEHSLALRSDGSIVGWGQNEYGEASPPPGNDFVAIAAGEQNSLALKAEKPKLGIVSRKRIGRTQFVYDCNATFVNLYSFSVKNLQLEIIEVPDNMTIIEQNVTFGDIEFGTRQSFTSTDTCTFIVDRLLPIDPDKIVWKVKCNRADTGMALELTINGVASSELETISRSLINEDQADFEDLAELVERWLWVGPAGSIPEDIVEDGIVNFADFALLAENWGM